MDYTRLSQATRVSGVLKLDGQEIVLGEGACGLRDRSWGIRPIGLGDPQPPAPIEMPQFFWLWCPVQFADRTIFWHVNQDRRGATWNTRGEICPRRRRTSIGLIHAHGEIDLELIRGHAG